MKPYTDATGTVDYGNIDEFYLTDEHYYLSGDWVKLKISHHRLCSTRSRCVVEELGPGGTTCV